MRLTRSLATRVATVVVAEHRQLLGDAANRGPFDLMLIAPSAAYTVMHTVPDPAGLFATEMTTATIAPPGHLKQRRP